MCNTIIKKIKYAIKHEINPVILTHYNFFKANCISDDKLGKAQAETESTKQQLLT